MRKHNQCAEPQLENFTDGNRYLYFFPFINQHYQINKRKKTVTQDEHISKVRADFGRIRDSKFTENAQTFTLTFLLTVSTQL